MAVEFADKKPEGFVDAGTTWEIEQTSIPEWLREWPSSEGRSAPVGMPVRHSVLRLRRVHRYISSGLSRQYRANPRNGVYVQTDATMQLVVTSLSVGSHVPDRGRGVPGDYLNISGVLHNAGGAWKVVGIMISAVYARSDNRWRVDITSSPIAIPDGIELLDASGVVDLVAVGQSGH